MNTNGKMKAIKQARAIRAADEIEKRFAVAAKPVQKRKIKAVSIRQPWASMIAAGDKTIETRTWPTRYRGELLICSSKGPICRQLSGLPYGKALATARLADCRPMTPTDEPAARCGWYDGAWAWVLEDIRAIERPFDVKGQLGIYEVEIEVDRITKLTGKNGS